VHRLRCTVAVGTTTEAAIRPRVVVVRFATGSRAGSFGFRTARTTTKPDAAAAAVVETVANAAAGVGTVVAVVAVDVAEDAADAVAVAVAAVADTAVVLWTGSVVVVENWIP